MKSVRLVILAVLAAAVGCGGSRQAVGTVSSVIVIATDSLWTAIGDSILSALEPRIFTVRDERTFEVTHVSPTDPNLSQLRQFRQIVALGAAEDAWVEPVLRSADRRDAAAGSIVQTDDVWARNQFVTAVVLPESSAAEAALMHVGTMAAAIDSAFRAYAVQRMYTSRPDSILRDSLRANAGFSILLPNVYEQVATGTGVLLFQNATQVGGTLIRSFYIASREGVQEPTTEAALAWRDSIAATDYRPAQRTEQDRIAAAPVTAAGGAQGVEVQGVWSGTDPSWPSSGPFIARMITCPGADRTFLLDAWLFAPARAKYEYMIQLETILGTFECS